MKVFLSYSRRDDAIATEVRRRLEARGHEIWQDELLAGVLARR